MKARTWPVFLVGLGALLALIALPGLIGLRQSARMYDEVLSIQSAHEHSQQTLFQIEREVLQVSLAVRDFLLDDSAGGASIHGERFRLLRKRTESRLETVAQTVPADQAGMFDQLREQLREYWDNLEPVFAWNREQRSARGALFLQQQQRPRRQAVLAIADEIRRLNGESYRRRYAEMKESQQRSRRQWEVATAITFLIGLAVALASIGRIWVLERQSQAQRMATERAEHELRNLSARLMEAQEEERRTISRELHDEVGQMLTGLRIELGTLDKLRGGPPEQFAEHLNESKALAEQTLRIVRDIAVGLRPSVLDLGLEPALQWQARHFSRRTGTDASVQIDPRLTSLPDSYSTCIYRIVQEALTNSARHSSAKNIEVRVSVAGEEMELAIADDGTGLPENWAASRGLGLIGIEERAREIGGSVSIQSRPGEGLAVRVRMPLPQGVTT